MNYWPTSIYLCTFHQKASEKHETRNKITSGARAGAGAGAAGFESSPLTLSSPT